MSYKYNIPLLVKIFTIISLFQFSLNQTCSDATYTCYRSAVTADFAGIRAQFIKKLRNAGTIKSDISDNLLPTYKTQIQSLIDELDNNWSAELTNYALSINDLYKNPKYFPNLRSVYIKEASTGKCLTYTGSAGLMTITNCSNLDVNQMFKFCPSISGSFWIQSRANSSHYVINKDTVDANGNKIWGRFFVYVISIEWVPQVSGSGFKLINPATNKCMQYNTSDFGAEIWECNTTGKQIFKIIIAEI